MAKWRDEFFADLVERGQRIGIDTWDREKVKNLILKQNEIEAGNGFTKSVKKHYKKAAEFSELGMKKLLNAAEKVWPGYKAKKKRVYTRNKPPIKKAHPSKAAAPKPKKKEEPKWGPDCVACEDTGKNSNGGDCVPCLKAGRIKELVSAPETVGPPVAPLPPPPPPPSGGVSLPPPPPPPPSTMSLPPPPIAPVSVGKTYAKTNGTTTIQAQTHRCCIVVRLTDKDARNLTREVVLDTLHRYLVEETGFGAVVKDAKELEFRLWDLLIEYSVHITKFYDLLEEHDWIEAAIAKPAADFGSRTQAIP